MNDDGRDIIIHLVGEMYEEGDELFGDIGTHIDYRAAEVTAYDGFIEVYWFPNDDQVEFIPWHRVHRVFGPKGS